MKILIIEDEHPAVEKLRRLIQDMLPETEILATLESVEGAVNWLSENPHPDLVFMDIQLDDGLCFEIFEHIGLKSPVIFITAYDEYALRAFRVNSIDYILKPVSEEALRRAIKKYKNLYEDKDYMEKLEKLISTLPYVGKERFLIRIGEHYRPVQSADIRCIYIREKNNFFFTRSGMSYPVDLSLDRLERMLDPSKFFRVNRNVIIAYSAIRDIISYSSSRIRIIIEGWDAGEDIIVSRERVAAFKEWMVRG